MYLLSVTATLWLAAAASAVIWWAATWALKRLIVFAHKPSIPRFP